MSFLNRTYHIALAFEFAIFSVATNRCAYFKCMHCIFFLEITDEHSDYSALLLFQFMSQDLISPYDTDFNSFKPLLKLEAQILLVNKSIYSTALKLIQILLNVCFFYTTIIKLMIHAIMEEEMMCWVSWHQMRLLRFFFSENGFGFIRQRRRHSASLRERPKEDRKSAHSTRSKWLDLDHSGEMVQIARTSGEKLFFSHRGNEGQKRQIPGLRPKITLFFPPAIETCGGAVLI